MTGRRAGRAVLAVAAAGVAGGALHASTDPPTGTYALLSDRASATAAAGAGFLTLTAVVEGADPSSPELVVGPGREAVADLAVGTSDTLRWVVSVEVVSADGQELSCAPGEDRQLWIRVGAAAPSPVDGCLGADDVWSGAGPRSGEVTVLAGGGGQAEPWAGAVRLTVRQVTDGWTHHVDVPFGVHDPAQQAGSSGAAGTDQPVPPAASGPSPAGDPPPGGPPSPGEVTGPEPAPEAPAGPAGAAEPGPEDPGGPAAAGTSPVVDGGEVTADGPVTGS